MSLLGSSIKKHVFFCCCCFFCFYYHCYANNTQLYLSFQTDYLKVASCISASLTDISCRTKGHHFQLNLAKTELIVVSANPTLHHNFSIQLRKFVNHNSIQGRKLGVVIDDELNFTNHIARTAWFCRFALYNIRPFLSKLDTQLIVHALLLSRLDYCNALLAGLPA